MFKGIWDQEIGIWTMVNFRPLLERGHRLFVGCAHPWTPLYLDGTLYLTSWQKGYIFEKTLYTTSTFQISYP